MMHKLFLALGFGTFVLGSGHSPDSLAETPSPSVYILDVRVLNELEAGGYSLGETLGGTKLTRTADLYKSHSGYRSAVDVIGKTLPHDKITDQLPGLIPENSGDVPDMVRRLRGFEDKGARSDNDLKGGFIIRRVANNSSYPYAVEQDGDEPRHFDTRWLNSEYGYMKLIAVANRLDRSDITADSCGEVRFIYRLSYKSKKASSSLPFFMNVVHQYPRKSNCAEYAERWVSGPKTVAAMKNGPLKNLTFRQLEVGFQSLRFTSGYMHDFGGQAMYMQRVFRKSGDRLEPVELENTPDVQAVAKDPTLLKRFVEFLKVPGNLQKLDDGTLNINFDDKFLAKLAISWSTLGRARGANRPYAEIFRSENELLNSIDIAGLKYIKSHEALVERLDNLTCMGCHQSGGTAGFHMLGVADPGFSHPFNRQETPLSPHASSEVTRRLAWTQTVASGKAPNRFRPHSIYSTANWSEAGGMPKFADLKVGQLCVADTGVFATQPACGDAGGRAVECRKTVSNVGSQVILGECVLKEPVRAGGAVCWQGEIREGMNEQLVKNPPAFNFYAFVDKWKIKGAVSKDLKGYGCVLPQSGAPLGRISRKCTVQEENFEVDFAKGIPDEICANQGGVGFDMCAASGDAGACLETKVARSMLDTCSDTRTCREDYTCQKFPDYHKISVKDYVRKKGDQLINLSNPAKIKGAMIEEARKRGIGFCVPTYFLFNMRLDGHPSPVTGLPPGEPIVDRTRPLRGYQ